MVINALVYLFLNPILTFLRVPANVWDGMRDYLLIIFAGLIATSLYNFFSCLLRALGNSSIPLVFLAISAILNIVLDLLFVAVLPFGIKGAALATILAQYVSGIGILIYVLLRCRELLPAKEELHFDRKILKEILNLSSMTCVQQSVMNFGILMVQDFGNAYSTFVAQNYGAGNKDRIRKGTHQAFALSIFFCVIIFCCGLCLCISTDADLRQQSGNCRDLTRNPCSSRLCPFCLYQ